jgi:D-alanyl-D-alanine carboxypeptidase
VITDEEYKDMKVHTDFKKNTDAPVHTGDLMGTMTISTDLGETLFKCNVVAANNAERFKFKDSFKRIMEIWFKNWINDYLKSVS